MAMSSWTLKALGTQCTAFTVRSVFQNPLKPPYHEKPQRPREFRCAGGHGPAHIAGKAPAIPFTGEWFRRRRLFQPAAGAGCALPARGSPSRQLFPLRAQEILSVGSPFCCEWPLEGERTTKAGGACCFGGVQSMVGVYAWRWGRCRYASWQPSVSRLFSPTQQLTPRAFAF